MKNFTEEDYSNEFNQIKSKVSHGDVDKVLGKEEQIYGKSSSGPLAKFFDDIKLLFSVVKDYKKGVYREIPWTSIAAIVGALIYVISPIDLIPDFIPVIGLVDDAAVLAFCLKAVHNDLQTYKNWKENQR